MFFRREKPHRYTFAERLDQLREARFTIQQEGESKAIAVRDCCAAVIEAAAEGSRIGPIGRVIGNELAELVELGYQKVWQTPAGHREPAQATHLQTLHAFTEDLRGLLGLTSLYNESLGTVNASHHYDRVADRDSGAEKRPWDR
ncbi:MAG: hypothetical protein GY953_47005 [bacterium]|nr:hypothetical protein [bacterium]